MNKPITFSNHARQQMQLRGATEAEVETVVRRGSGEPALRGKFKTRLNFDFNQASPVNNQLYRFKTVEAIFADEPDEVVIVTVLVYYSN